MDRKREVVFGRKYRDAYDIEPIGYSAMGYDATKIFLSALLAGADNRSAVLSRVAAYSGRGVAGRYQFTTAGDPAASAVGRWAYNGSGVAPIPAG
jgi:ABC-type branched-subunit amino acid transport system substrate-binding protein